MPAGKPWCTEAPDFRNVPTEPMWRVHPQAYGPLAANRNSRARGALVGTHGMFFAADSLSGALWEATLRYAAVGRGRVARFPLFKLRGMVASRIRATRSDIPLLELGRPGILSLFPDGDGPEVLAVNSLLVNPKHEETHPEFRQLEQDLQSVGVVEMPVVSWPSRQFPKSTVYLAYDPPMVDSWWEVLGPPIALDSPAGLALIQDELASHGFTFEPLDTIPAGPP